MCGSFRTTANASAFIKASVVGGTVKDLSTMSDILIIRPTSLAPSFSRPADLVGPSDVILKRLGANWGERDDARC